VSAPPTWDAFRDEVAAIAQVDAASLGPDSRLVEDLALDSVALVEVAVLLMDDLGMAALSAELEERSWEDVRLGALYAELAG
jgi:acyl carrier protein